MRSGIATRPAKGLHVSLRLWVSGDPLTRAHVRLLGPCFKTGRVGYRPTRRKPREHLRGRNNPARPASRRPHRHHGTNPDNRRRQACPAGSPLRFQRASSFGPPDNREKPMGPGRGDQLFAHGTGVTPAKPSPKEQAGNLHGRAQSGAFSIDPRPSRRSTGGGKCVPRRLRHTQAAGTAPREGPFT